MEEIKKEKKRIKFNAVVGNPPYQGVNHQQIYPFFYKTAIALGEHVSMIFPTGWQEPKNANNLSQLNNKEIKEDKQIVFINNVEDVFDGITGAKWTNILLWKKDHDNKLDGKQRILTNGANEEIRKLIYDPSEIKKPENIIKLVELVRDDKFISISDNISVHRPYGLRTDIFDEFEKYNLPELGIKKESDDDIVVYGKNKEIRYISKDYPLPRVSDRLNKFKILMPKAWGNMSENIGLGGSYANIIIAKPNEICTETYIESCSFDDYDTAYKHAKYTMSKFARALLYMCKMSQQNVKGIWENVPLQDFSEDWWDLSIEEIDNKLMDKYNVPNDVREYVFNNIQTKTEDNIVGYNPSTNKSK